MAATYGFQRIKILSMEEQPLHFCTENLAVSTTTMSSFPSLSRSGGLADRSLVRVPWPLGPAFWPGPSPAGNRASAAASRLFTHIPASN